MPTRKQDDLVRENDQLRRRIGELERHLAHHSQATGARQLDAFRSLSHDLVTEPNLQALLALIVRRIAELVDGGNGTVWLWDDPSETLVLQTPIPHEEAGQRLRSGEGLAGVVAVCREGLVVNDYRTWPHARQDILARTNITAAIAQPLLYRERLIGVLSVDNDRTGRSFGVQDQAVLRLFAPHAAVAIENARLRETMCRRVEELACLTALTRTLATSLEPAQVVREILAAVEALIPGIAVRLWERREGEEVLQLAGSIGLRESVEGRRLRFVLGEGMLGIVAATRQPLACLDVTQDPRFVNKEWAAAEGLVSAILIPLIHRGDFLGNLAIFTRVPHRFDPDEVTLLQAFADHAAVALSNARLYAAAQRELRDRERAEVALFKNETELRSLFRAAPIGIGTVVNRVLVGVNDRLCDMVAYTEAELRNQSARILYTTDDDYEQVGREKYAQIRSAGVGTVETRWRRKDGALLDILLSSAPRDPENWSAGVVFTALDITARKQAERAATARGAQLEAMRAVGAEMTRELNLVRLLELLLRQLGELVEGSVGSVHLWDESSQCLLPNVSRGVDPWRRALRMRLGEGVSGTVAQRRQGMIVNNFRESPYCTPYHEQHSCHTAVMAEPLLYGDRLLGVITLDNGVSDRQFAQDDQQLLRLFADQAAVAIENARLFQTEKRRRKQLEALQTVSEEIRHELELPRLLDLILERANALVGTASGALFLWDNTQQVLEPVVNRGFGDWYAGMRLRLGEGVAGAAAQRRAGLIVNDFQRSPYVLPFLAAAHSEVSTVRTSLAEPLLFRDRLLGVVVLRDKTSGADFAEEDRELLRLFAAQAAIAIEHARLFEELRRSYADLQRAQEEFVRSETLRALGQMSAGIAHDLNNMLAAILGQVELLKLRRQDSEIGEALATLEMAATDGAQTVRRLQDFARPRRQAPLAPVNLERVVAEAVEMTRPRWHDEATRRGADVRVQIAAGGLSAIMGHGPEIREALTNLIFNAVDAMPQGGKLRLTGRQIPSDGGDDPGWVELDVQDTGIGIPEDIQQRIFDPFFTTKGLRGMGLGLSVVYGIMERHGGHITVASTPGVGTTFTLRFRAAAADAPAMSPPAPAPGLCRRLLVIEDEETVRHTLVRLLSAAGHVVFEAADGPAGLRVLAAEPVDCVFTDLGMPGMLGWEVASAVKAIRPALPVVLLTGWGEQATTEVAQTTAVDRLLPKPVRLADLLDAVRDLAGEAADHSSRP